VQRIEIFRKNPQTSDITVNAMDTLISCAAVFKFTHNYINFGIEVTALVEKRTNKKDAETANMNTENKKKRLLENTNEEQELPQQKIIKRTNISEGKQEVDNNESLNNSYMYDFIRASTISTNEHFIIYPVDTITQFFAINI